MHRRVRKGKQDLQIYLLIIGKMGYGELGPESQKTAIEWGNGWELRILIQAHHYEQRESKFVKWKLWVTKNCSLCRAKTCWSFFINMWYAGWYIIFTCTKHQICMLKIALSCKILMKNNNSNYIQSYKFLKVVFMLQCVI